jgi:hypothetical protein
VYKQWICSQDPNREDLKKLSKEVISVDEFVRLTGNKAMGRFIALIDNHLRFDELPLSPHDNIVRHVMLTFSDQFKALQEDHTLGASGSNGSTYITIHAYCCRCYFA